MQKTPSTLQDVEAQLSTAADVGLNDGTRLATRCGEHAQAAGFIEHLLAMPRPTKARRRPVRERPVIRMRNMVLE